MNKLYISLKSLNANQVELRYWQGRRSDYEEQILAIAEIEDLIGQSELDYYVRRPRLETLGRRLFEWLDGNGRWLSRAIQDCGEPCLALAIAVEGRLAHLPWEVMHDGTTFLVEKQFPLVVPLRWMDQPTQARPPLNRPLQVLFMASSPQNVEPVLDFEGEEAEILRITKTLPLTLRVEESGCVDELNNVWRRYDQDTYDVFHLTGHASLQGDAPFAPFFITESLTGERIETRAKELQRVFQSRPPRLIFLSGCRTGEAGQLGTVPSLAETLVRQGMPCVMGWGRPVLDTSATQAAAWFYEQLAAGEGLVSALGMTYCRLLEEQEKFAGWHLLRLYVRGEEWGAVVEPPGDYFPPSEPVQYQFLDYDGNVRVASRESFVGRRRVLQQGLRALKQGRTIGVMLHGMGGVGKSTVAARLLERLSEYQPVVIFQGLDAAKLERLLSKRFASELGVEKLNSRLPLAQRLREFLRQGLNEPKRPLIFVLDDFEANLDTREDGSQVLQSEVVEVLMALMDGIVQSRQPHRILITSRYDVRFPELNERIERIPLASLRGADLQKKCDRLEGFRKETGRDEAIQQRAKALADGNPRLLEWLDKILLDRQTDTSRILEAMSAKTEEFRESILAAQLLEQQSVEVRQMLSRMQIYELPVPLSALTAVCQGIENLDRHRERAIAIGLLECDRTSGQELYRLPRILTPLLEGGTDESLYRLGLDELYRLWWEQSNCSEDQALELLRLAQSAHAEGIADEIGSAIGSRWREQGRYRDAGNVWEQILENRRLRLGDEHEEIAAGIAWVAFLYNEQGRYEEAEPLYKQALQMRQKLLGQEHPDVASSLNNLALLYYNQGRYEEAEPLYKQALQMSQKLLGQEHPNVASNLNNLASLYDNQGRYEEAEPLYKQALQMRQKLLGQEHPDVASSLNNLALLYDNQGRYEEAEPLHKQALQMRQKLLGQEHPDVASSLNNLALLYDNQGRYEEAEPLYKQALQMRQKLLGQEHPNVASSLHNLAGLYKNQGRYEEAEPLYKQALQMSQKLLGQEHPDVATSLNNLALLYYNQGRYEEAEPLYKQALQMCQKLLGQEHPDVASSLLNLGTLYQQQGKYSDARTLYLQAIAIAQAKLGPNHPNTQTMIAWLNSLPE